MTIYILEREMSGSNREIVVTAYKRAVVVEHIKRDINRWTLPVTYHISSHKPEGLAEDAD